MMVRAYSYNSYSFKRDSFEIASFDEPGTLTRSSVFCGNTCRTETWWTLTAAKNGRQHLEIDRGSP